jgi:hypothetical protein
MPNFGNRFANCGPRLLRFPERRSDDSFGITLGRERLTFRFQGRQYRLTDVSGQVVKGILA